MKNQIAVFVALFALLGMIIATPLQIFAQEPEVTTSTVSSTPIEITANDIQRGNTQTVHIETGMPADIIGKVTYPSGHQIIFQGATDESGALDYSWKVGGNTKPGTATVDILASTDNGRASGSTTFGIYPKGALIPTPPPTEENVTAPTPEPVPVENDTTTAPEEPIVVVPENETNVVTPDNSTDIIPPVNDTSIVFPSNETTVPEPTTNDSEVIIAPENETEIVTGDNASEVPEIPDEVIDDINDTEIIVPGNETTVGENTTVTEPLPPDLTPITNDTTAGNVTDIIVVPPANVTGIPEELPPPSENVTDTIPAENVTQVPLENVTEGAPSENVTAPPEEIPIPVTPNGTTPIEPPFETQIPPPSENITIEAPTEGNVTVETPDTNITVTEPGVTPTEPPINATTPEEAIDQGEEAADVLDDAVESGNVDEIIAAMQDAIQAVKDIAVVVPEASDEERDNAEDTVNRMNELISEAFNEVSE